jgi:hypothetical protein
MENIKNIIEFLDSSKSRIPELLDVLSEFNEESQDIAYQKVIQPIVTTIVEKENILCRKVVDLVDEILDNYEGQKGINKFGNDLITLYNLLSTRGNGKLIKHYPEKKRLAFCYYLMIKHLNFSDRDIYEVCAENAFYCIVDYNKNAWFYDRVVDINTLYLTLHTGGEYLKEYIDRLLFKEIKNNETVFELNDFANGADYIIAQFKLSVAYMIKISGAEINLKGEAGVELNNLLINVKEVDLNQIILKSYHIAECLERVLDDFDNSK